MINDLRFLGDRIKTYSNAPQNQIGTDQDFEDLWGLSISKIRTVETHNDSNCMYIAKNGSDTTGDGTYANPFATIQKGINSAIVSGDIIATVIRNGVTGDLIFQENILITGDITLQVETGDVATILDNSGGNISFNMSNQSTNAYYSFFSTETGDRVFGGSVGDGLYASDNYGLDWSKISSSNLNTKTLYGFTQTITNRLLVGTDLGIFYSDDLGDNWSVTNSISNDFYNFVVLSTGRIIASSDTGLYYSDDDGVNWYQGNITSGLFYGMVVLSNKRILVTSSVGIYYSDDNGINWFLNSKTNGVFKSILQLLTLRVIAAGTNGVLYSDDNGNNWTQTGTFSVALNGLSIMANNNILAWSNSFYFSEDNGENWTNIGTTGLGAGSYQGIYVLKNNRVLLGSNSGIFYSKDTSVISSFNPNHTIMINGFIIDGDNNKIFGSDVQTKYCHFRNMWTGAYFIKANPTIKNNICHNVYNGFLSKKGDYQENLVFDCEDYAITIYDSEFTFNHNTIYLAKQGLHLEDTITTYTLKNCIVHKCDVPISSIITQLTVSNSVLYYNLYNCITSNSKKGILNPIFRSEEIDGDFDFRIQVKEDNKPCNSIAKGLADDNYDSGCYLIDRSLSSDIFNLDITLEFPPMSDERIFKLTNSQISEVANGDVIKDYENTRLVFKFNFGNISNWIFFNQLVQLLKDKKGLRMIPNSLGMDNGIGDFDFTNLTLTITESKWEYNYWYGYGIKITLNSVDRYFRIISNTSNTLTLENKEEYTSLANENSVNYSIEFIPVKCTTTELSGNREVYTGFNIDDEKPNSDNVPFFGFSLEFEQTKWI